MAAKVEKLGTTLTAAACFAAVFIANWLSAKYISYPFVWCLGKWILEPIFQPWLFVTHFLALGYFVVCVLRRDAFKMVQGLMVTIAVFGIGTFSEILFRLGKSCG